MNHFDRDKLSAIEAKQEAQRIAFAPFMFQAAKALRDMGVLAAIEAGRLMHKRLRELAARRFLV